MKLRAARALGRLYLHPWMPAVVTGAYLALGSLWIWGSDRAAAAVFSGVEDLSRFQSLKGVTYVLATGAALFLWLLGTRRLVLRLPVVERMLRDVTRQYRGLVELAPDGILVHSEGTVLYANPAFKRALGLPEQATLKHRQLLDFVAPEDRAMIAARIESLAKRLPVPTPVEIRLCTVAGDVVEVELASSPVQSHDRVVIQSHFRDLTARNRARRALVEANQELDRRIAERTTELQAANCALESFTYSVAHDLRGPVEHVAGFAGALRAALEQTDTARVNHYADRIVANSHAMSAMIDGLLNLSRAGRTELTLERIDTAALVRHTLEELGGATSAEVVIGELPAVVADAATLRQVWTNLLSNALKYSSRAEQPRVTIGAQRGAAEVVFEVTDNGVGFDESEAQQLFKVFSRLGSGREFPGTGVGLTIVQRIVERHGGRVWAEGRPGAGATFRFSLPQ